MKKEYVILLGVLIVLVIGGVFLFGGSKSVEKNDPGNIGEAGGVAGDPLDLTIDFYTEWLGVVTQEDVDPHTSPVASNPLLSSRMQELIKSFDAADAEPDPILCQNEVPSDLRSRPVFVHDDSAQILITPRNGDDLLQQIQVTLKMGGTGWLITDIICTNGEVAPDREFSFAREGQLLKDVPPPLNREYWHLVFEQNGVMGHTVPLFFETESICISQEGIESGCNQENFTQTAKVFIEGEMTEAGLAVKRLTEL